MGLPFSNPIQHVRAVEDMRCIKRVFAELDQTRGGRKPRTFRAG